MSARAIRYLVDDYLEALSLKAAGVSCHSLRHSAATRARASSAKLDAIARPLALPKGGGNSVTLLSAEKLAWSSRSKTGTCGWLCFVLGDQDPLI